MVDIPRRLLTCHEVVCEGAAIAIYAMVTNDGVGPLRT